jgi:hypothetical protein
VKDFLDILFDVSYANGVASQDDPAGRSFTPGGAALG